MYHFIPVHTCDDLYEIWETWRLTKAITEMEYDTEQKMKLDVVYKVGSECELNS